MHNLNCSRTRKLDEFVRSNWKPQFCATENELLKPLKIALNLPNEVFEKLSLMCVESATSALKHWEGVSEHFLRHRIEFGTAITFVEFLSRREWTSAFLWGNIKNYYGRRQFHMSVAPKIEKLTKIFFFQSCPNCAHQLFLSEFFN